MDTLCSDMMLSLCSFLDDEAYIHLWITCKKYCVLLRSEIFLRTLFRDRQPDTLTLKDLRRGFKNIIKTPTITLFENQRLVNHYLYTNDRFIFDIFERLWIIEADKLRNSGLIVQVTRVFKIVGLNYYYLKSHDNELIITNDELEPVMVFPDVDNTIVQSGMLLFRQYGRYQLYIPERELIPLAECVLAHKDIKTAIVTLTATQEQSIDLILDYQGRLIIEHKVVAHNVDKVNVLDKVISYSTYDGEIGLVHAGKAQVIVRNMKNYVRVNRESFFYRTQDGACYKYIDSHITQECKKGIFVGTRNGWSFMNSELITDNDPVPRRAEVQSMYMGSYIGNQYIVARYKALY